MNVREIGLIFLVLFSILTIGFDKTHAAGVVDLFEDEIVISVQDTIPFEDRYGDFVTDQTYNPFDIQTSEIEQVVEFDYESGQYLIYEKIGDEYFRTPIYLTMKEYLEYTQKQQEREQFLNLSGVQLKKVSFGADADPLSKFDLEGALTDRLFGGIDVEIKPTGFVDMTFGVDYQKTENPNLSDEQQRGGGGFPFDFDMDINAGIDGNIGEKLNLDFDYNTLATFDFDNTLNFGYNSEDFDEDDIIKRIEAGNISLPLRSQLIKGREDLFGLLTELQFGPFRITGVAAQVRAQQSGITIENGGVKQTFEIRPDEYDENRHFFISHYNREQYESALSNLPQIQSIFRVVNIEVWVTNNQNSDLQYATTVAAIADLGETDIDNFTNESPLYPPLSTIPSMQDRDGNALPDNSSSGLFKELINDNTTRTIINTSTRLKSKYGLNQVRDFEVQTMRKLRPDEFTFYPQLGFISLNSRLRSNQVLGVSYEYTYAFNGSEIYKVGEISNEINTGGLSEQSEPEPEDVVYVKMLKSTNQAVKRSALPEAPVAPMWKLMMKNIYSLPTSQLSDEDFKFDILFEDFSTNTLKRYIPEPEVRNIPLMNLFRLDQLNRQGDPQQDGEFDFIPGVTVNTRTGSIIFPVLEPFGKSMLELLGGNDELYQRYGFASLYNESLVMARQNLDNNRFVMRGEFKGSASDEIQLGFGVNANSVAVWAGSQKLQRGIDYEVDELAGRIKILNQLYIQQGVPLRVDYEDNNLFSLQRQTMFGLRGDYQVSDKFNLGFTYMRLFERPFTQKVNFGSDPINNRMYGFDMDFTTEAPFITKVLDALPLISTKEKSSISFTGEIAALKPGHSKAINIPGEEGAVVSLDDFEGSGSSLPLAGFNNNAWVLASTPDRPEGLGNRFPESQLNNNLRYGANRALLNWFVVNDQRSNNNESSPYTRRVDVTDLFNRDLDLNQLSDLRPFDLVYYPDERGPYNYDPEEGFSGISAGAVEDNFTGTIKLNEPETRWAGIMRELSNNDFEQSNYQFIEFWMLNPFMEPEGSDFQHGEGEEGMLVFNLGNVSEDLMKDNLQYFENSNAVPGENIPTQETEWGKVPLSIPNVRGFNQEFISIQDLGFDGLSDFQEANKYADYVNNFSGARDDPANDNYVSYLNDEAYPEGTPYLDRFKKFNNPEANVPQPGLQNRLGNSLPDSEDLNNNRSLEQSESYYEYPLFLKNNQGEIDLSSARIRNLVTDINIVNVTNGPDEKWYRFRIPIEDSKLRNEINGIQGLRSIQFMRLYMTGFKTKKMFRLAEFELTRNQWRISPTTCNSDAVGQLNFVMDDVGIEENSDRLPFNYVLPKGIKQEQFFSTFSTTFQDERSMNLRVCGLPDSCEVSINKLQIQDLRQYETLQMFVHAENAPDEDGVLKELNDGDMEIYIRLGKDFNNNYYEYSIPLTMSDPDNLPNVDPSMKGLTIVPYQAEVWRVENMFDFNLGVFPDIKRKRNEASVISEERYELSIKDFVNFDSVPNLNARVAIKGNPSVGYIKSFVIGIRNPRDGNKDRLCANVWVNELRLKGLNEEGGVAGLARMDIQLADLGNITASTSYSSIGFGQIDDAVANRNLAEFIDYDVATNLELGKLFPTEWGLSLPFYYQFARSIQKEKYDQYELDLTADELLINLNLNENQREDIADRNKRQTTIKTLNITNARKQRTAKADERRKEKGKEPKKPMPWDISNFSVSYGYTQTEYKDYLIKSDKKTQHTGSLDYGFSKAAKYIQPFKNLKAKPLRFIKEINFNPFPNSISFNTDLKRLKGEKLYRVPDINEGFEYFFNDQKFTWDRNYALQWDFTKSLKLSYDASAQAVIDELRQVGIASTRDQREWADEFGNFDENGISFSDQISSNPNLPNDYRNQNFRDFGRMKNFTQGISLSYTLPFKYLPGMDWITARAQYDGDYSWTAGSRLLNNIQNDDEKIVGNIIQNNQRRAFNTTMAFDKLYDKLPYFKLINKKPRRSSRARRSGSPRAASNDRSSRKKTREASIFEKLFVRPLLSVREVKFNYSQDLSTVIPGFLESPKYLGISSSQQPGYAFAFGLQPEVTTFLKELSDGGYISENPFLNQQVHQTNVKNYDAKVELEPWPDFTINVDFKKSFTENTAFDYIHGPPLNPETQGPLDDFGVRGLRNFGSYQVSYWGLQTLFNGDILSTFRQFEKNRIAISARRLREDKASGINRPDLPHDKDGPLYAQGYGRQNQDVLIPAFIAAYTGVDPELIDLDLTKQISKTGFIPKPSWQLRYNGLNKLPFFKDIFSSVSITHGYEGVLEVNSFQTDLQYDKYYEQNFRGTEIINQNVDVNFIDPLISTKNYFSRYEIPDIVLSERFAPIIGIDMKTVNNMNINIEYSKSRILSLDLGVGQLNEVNTTEFIFGFGWILEDVKIGFLTGRTIKVPKIKVGIDTENGLSKGEKEKNRDDPKAGERGVKVDQNKMNITFNFGFRDDITFLHELDSGASAKPTRGIKSLSISPSVDYDINKNFTLRAFVDYMMTQPYVSDSYRSTRIEGGITARFNLN
ncbi:MAG: cell surface protein SprA [Saprospiraceae bacterium]